MSKNNQAETPTPEKKPAPLAEAVAKAVTPSMIKAGVVPEMLMQQIHDALRDHVPHKHAEPLLQAMKSIQYGNFPVGPAVKAPE